MAAVYQLTFEDGAIYIGSALDVSARRARHELLATLYAGRVNFTFALLAETAKRAEAFKIERERIAAARAAGVTLRNGDSAAHWRGRPKSAETRAKIGAANRGKTRGRRKLADAQIIRMKVMRWTAGWTQEELAHEFKLNRSTVRYYLGVTV